MPGLDGESAIWVRLTEIDGTAVGDELSLTAAIALEPLANDSSSFLVYEVLIIGGYINVRGNRRKWSSSGCEILSLGTPLSRPVGLVIRDWWLDRPRISLYTWFTKFQMWVRVRAWYEASPISACWVLGVTSAIMRGLWREPSAQPPHVDCVRK